MELIDGGGQFGLVPTKVYQDVADDDSSDPSNKDDSFMHVKPSDLN